MGLQRVAAWEPRLEVTAGCHGNFQRYHVHLVALVTQTMLSLSIWTEPIEGEFQTNP